MKLEFAAVVVVAGFALLCLHVQSVNGQVKVAAFNIKNLEMTRFDRDWITDVIIKVCGHAASLSYTKYYTAKILQFNPQNSPFSCRIVYNNE